MNGLGEWIDWWNRRVKLCTIWDVKLIQLGTVAFWMIVLKIFPQILELSVLWFVTAIVLCAPRLIYVWFVKEDAPTGAQAVENPAA